MWENNGNAEINAPQTTQAPADGVNILKGGWGEVCWNFMRAIDAKALFNFGDSNLKTVVPANPQYAYRNTMVVTNAPVGGVSFADIGNSADNPPTTNNVVRIFDHALVTSRSQSGYWIVRYGYSPQPRGAVTHTDSSALEYLPNGVLEGTLFSTNSTGVSADTGRLESTWVEYRGQRGAYVE